MPAGFSTALRRISARVSEAMQPSFFALDENKTETYGFARA
jgi:hypothetical protein